MAFEEHMGEGDDDSEVLDDDVDRSEAIDEMKQWFLERYEDPAHRTPYESAEGGYIWIWGGPYDAREVLEDAFYEEYPEAWIAQAAEDLEEDCTQWAPVPSESDYDTSLYEVISSNTEPLGTLARSLDVIDGLLEQDLDTSLSKPLLRLLYANCITVAETYLSDSFINRVLNDDTLLQKFLDKTPDLYRQQVPLSEVLREAAAIRDRVKRYLLDVVWHNLGKVQAMYRDTLDVDFADKIPTVAKAVPIRHDIIHRNGFDKDGNEVHVSSSDVRALVDGVRAMAVAVDTQITRAEDDLVF